MMQLVGTFWYFAETGGLKNKKGGSLSRL